jgi:ABC-type lipoprotein release transport system permease subunit
MLRNYISAALGNIGRNGLYAGITILGLAVSFAAAILIDWRAARARPASALRYE